MGLGGKSDLRHNECHVGEGAVEVDIESKLRFRHDDGNIAR